MQVPFECHTRESSAVWKDIPEGERIGVRADLGTLWITPDGCGSVRREGAGSGVANAPWVPAGGRIQEPLQRQLRC